MKTKENKMKNKNIIIWILAIISTVSTTALITLWLIRPAAPDMPPFHHSKNKQHEKSFCCEKKMMDRLNLNAEQKEKFLAQRDSHHKKIDPMFDSLRSLRTKLFDELDNDAPDSAIINSCIMKISEQEAIVQREGVENILSMKKFLNPSQFDTLITIHSHAMMPMGKGMQKDMQKHCNKNENK